MSERKGLPVATRMRHDLHFVEELAAQHTQAIGQMIAIEQLRPNPSQPRRSFDQLEELVASIQQVGVLEPLLVRRAQHGYQIVSGERRYRAAQGAALRTVPCIVLDVDDARALEIALIENLQRRDLSAFEEAEGLQALIDQYGFTHDEVALRISKSRTSVTETLALCAMPRVVRTRLESSGIHSKSILLEIARCESEETMALLAERAINDGLTRDALRKLRRAPRGADGAPTQKTPPTPPRRLTFRSKSTGITVTVYLRAEHLSLPDVERSLLEAVRTLRSSGLPAQ